MPLNERIKELRLQNGLSQEKLAREFDITTRTIIQYEKGKTCPSVELLTRMAKFFKVSVAFLLDEQAE